MLVDVDRVQVADNHGKTLGKLLCALSLSIRETDVNGWYKKNSVVGILFTEIGIDSAKSVVGAMLARVNGALYSALTFEEFNRISISHYHVSRRMGPRCIATAESSDSVSGRVAA